MKKHFGMIKTALAAALGLLVLGACANPFISPRQGEGPAIDEGKSLVRIETGAGAERTALPAAVFDHYEYGFSHETAGDQTISPIEPNGNEFELSPGNWVVTVKAYAEPGSASLAATGSESFAVVLGVKTQVTVNLVPEASDGEGTLSYALAYPNGATVHAFSLTLLADTTEIDLVSGASTGSGSLTGSKTAGSGYYLAAASVTMNNIRTTKTEIVHIYKNLSTDLFLEFTDQDFKAILVFSSANSGPGSLRDAIANAPADSTIVLDLPENDRVITLTTTLAITKSLTIYGGGATITQSGLMGSLITVTDYAILAINRVHFKGGRTAGNGGAISTSSARLNLESCVFSDNHANGNGGAIYSSIVRIGGSTFYGNSADGSGGAISGAGNFTGNIFYGNTAGTKPAVNQTDTSAYSFNLTDSEDWTLTEGEKPADDLPLSPLSFRPLGGGAALNMLESRPSEYPVVDFYGRPVPATDGAAGAVQTATATGGYILDLGPTGSGQVGVSSETAPDADGLITGSVTLVAQESPEGAFRYWMVNGEKDPEPSATLTLDINAHTTVRAVFFVKVSATGDNVPGSLRAAAGAAGGSGIVLPEGSTLSLNGDLTIAANIVIEGNGSTLNLNGRHIVISGASTEVRISRLHLKGGKATTGVTAAASGGAITNGGILVIESCIFSGNQTPATINNDVGGGALYSTGSLTVLGSTFYGNSSAGSAQGGAIRVAGGTAVLQGNVFWGNTAASNPVIMGTVTSEGFNISDQSVASFNQTGDAVASFLPFTTVSFKPFAGGAAAGKTGERLESYPTEDFYGETITESPSWAAGAVQETIAPTGYVLDYAAQGPGEVRLIEGTVDEDGMTSGSVTLEAVDTVTGTFLYWTVNGTKVEPAPDPPNELEYDVQAHTVARAVFAGTWTVTTGADGGPGSFREALAIAADGDTIVLDGKTITLTEVLPDIAKKLTVKGEGATITQSNFIPGSATQLLRFAEGAEVSVSRVHFRGGRATSGAAIYNDRGTLTFESCIFSDNRTNNPSGSAYGGAIYTTYGDLNVYGCTFYDNSATGSYSYGGAIYKSGTGTIKLTGNVFWGNTAATYPMAYGVTTGGYNITDQPNGANYSGWTWAGTDARATAVPISPISLKPLYGGPAASKISSLPSGYPAVDFYGADIEAPAAAGAIQEVTAWGYFMDYAVEGPGTVTVTSGTPDGDGLYANDSSVILTAAPNGAGISLVRWVVNGTVDKETSNTLTLTMDSDKTVRAIFAGSWIVDSVDDDGLGSLRAALTGAGNWDRIVLQGQTIRLATPLEEITKSLFIIGNGATLTTQTGFTPGSLLSINSTTAEVSISRLHFKGGRTTGNGAAIYSNGAKLILESCIFSDNIAAGGSAVTSGGALYTVGASGNVTVSGCTFYGNSVTTTGNGRGGAIGKAAGTLTLTGNIFWGNTAPTSYSVAYASSGLVTSGGYNITDTPIGPGTTESGWAAGSAGDSQAIALPLSPVSFKPIYEGPALNVINPLPADYPAADFNGAAITAPAASGAIQGATAPGYVLDYAEQGPGEVSVNASADPDGIYAVSSSVTLTAASGAGGSFVHWLVNGTKHAELSNVLTLPMDGHKTVRAVFGIAVSSVADSGAGSLREVLEGAASGDIIVLPAGQTIRLASALSQITKSLVIMGNGATLTQNGSVTSPLLSIDSTTAEVHISRLHFKGGRAAGNGAAINSNGAKLTLESCIFSDNIAVGGSATTYGGALYISGTTSNVTVSGCAFYGNGITTTATAQGGAIYRNGTSTVTLTGNVFWGNTGGSYPVAHASSGFVTSGGYNITDTPIGAGAAQSDWAVSTGDSRATVLPLSPVSFKPIYEGQALGVITPALPLGYPDKDFNGAAITAPAASGAIQGATAAGYVLDYAEQGPGEVSVNVSGDPDGIYTPSSSVIFTAAPGDNASFVRWLVNGTPHAEPSNVLTLTMDGHKIVRAVFAPVWPVTNAGDDINESGSLRHAVSNALAGDVIALQTPTVTLTATLTINKNLEILGNGATITQTGLTTSAAHQLLSINTGTTVRINRVHFTGGRSKDQGSAIKNLGNLTLESCIFSDNITEYGGTTYSDGGAIYTTTGSLTVLGCTFTNNTAMTTTNGRGGAIERAGGTLTLTGNIFAGNIGGYPVVYWNPTGAATTGGYNVSDVASGTGLGQSGWTFKSDPADVQGNVVLDDGDFKLISFTPAVSDTPLPVIPPLLADFPATYFDGSPRGTTPGAMPLKAPE